MRPAPKKDGLWIFILILIWAVLAWLLYPLAVLDSADAGRAVSFFYRAAAGIVLMVILFGKTLFDLLFPRNTSRRRTNLPAVLTGLYAFALAAGIIFMIIRVLGAVLNKNAAAFLPK